jgi:phosphoglycolate phosphatase
MGKWVILFTHYVYLLYFCDYVRTIYIAITTKQVNMMKAVIFDFDGTLTELTLDFGSLKEEIIKVALDYASMDIIRSSEDHFVIEMIYRIANRMDARGPEFQKEAFNRLKSLELEASKGKDVFPYTRDLLKGLREKEIRTGIITRTCHDVLRQVFPDMNEYIHIAVTREDIREVKPDPAHVRKALRLLGVTPEEAMVVGDHPTDIQAGSALNMKTTGVLTGRTSEKAFQEARATFIFDDIRGIMSVV